MGAWSFASSSVLRHQHQFVFAVLVAAGYWFRHRSEIHNRLMVLAILGGLMGAPLAHLIGHIPAVRSVGPIILIPIAIFMFASAVYDRVSLGRIHTRFHCGVQYRFLCS